MRSAVVIAVLALVTVAEATPRQDLDLAVRNFRAGEWISTIRIVKDLLYPSSKFAQQDDVIEARMLLGAAHFESGNHDAAVDEFSKAILLDPERILTTLMFSEGAIRLYERTKADLRDRLDREAERKRLDAQAKALEDYRKTLKVYEARPFYLNFMPFGLAQFNQNRSRMGTVMALGQTSTFIASVGIFSYLVGTYGFQSNAVPLKEGPRVRALQQVEIGTGIGFFAFYAWGVYDAIRHHKARQLVQGDDSLIPPELLDPSKAKPPPKKTSLLDRLQLSPMVTPDSVGIGIGWEN